MSCPNANLEPRTATSTGPSMGATLTTFILVPGVSPMSSSRWRTLCSPRMKLILPYLPPLSSRIEMRFLFRLPTSSSLGCGVLCILRSSRRVDRRQGWFCRRRSRCRGVLGGGIGILLLRRRGHAPFGRLPCELCLFQCVRRLRGSFQAVGVFGLLFWASWSPFSVRVLPW